MWTKKVEHSRHALRKKEQNLENRKSLITNLSFRISTNIVKILMLFAPSPTNLVSQFEKKRHFLHTQGCADEEMNPHLHKYSSSKTLLLIIDVLFTYLQLVISV